jgi:UDP-2,4-diacetamido-2,4,6-trideoxy-beta-L-altropyranose hydrolase
MDKRKVILRADGGNQVGMGHFIRTLALAEILKDDFHCVYATQTPSPSQITEIRRVCHSYIELANDESHFNTFLDYLQGDEIVVLDNYYYTTEYQRSIKQKGCKLVCIDDLHDQHFVSDLVINHAPGICKSDYSTCKNTKLLLGLEYVLLRGSFLERAKFNKTYLNRDTVFINFGGEDRLNISLKVLNDLVKSKPSLKVKIVLGHSNHHLDAIREFISKSSTEIELFINRSASEMAEIIWNCDFAVVPCSTILFEVIACKLPFITGAYVENQKLIANYFNNQTNGIVLQNIVTDVIPWDSLINEVYTKNNNLIDGRSGIRLIEKFKEL